LISQRRSRVRRALTLSRRGRLTLLAPVAAGAAAAVAMALLPGSATAPALTVKLLADQAAAAALQQPSVSPDQWVFREIKYKIGGAATRLDPARDRGTRDTWETADGTRGDHNMGLFLGPLLGFAIPGLIPYAHLGSLPPDPAALERYLADHEPSLSWASPDKRAFDAIASILSQYVVPPRLAAELYRALADIPGVTVNAHATDVAGRPGVAFALPGRSVSEIILDPSTDALAGLAGQFGVLKLGRSSVTWLTYQVAIIREAFVSGNGVLP
jgi:hypothetical protein